MKTARQILEKRHPFINPETHSAAVGPIDLDVLMARKHGWSEKAIQRTYDKIAALSRREGAIAHRNGLVPGCPGVECDMSVPLEDLPEEYKKMRDALMDRTIKSAVVHTKEKYIYTTVRGIVVQVPGLDGKKRTRRAKSMEEAMRVRAALLSGLKVVSKR